MAKAKKETPVAEAATDVTTKKVVEKETPVTEAIADVTTEKVVEKEDNKAEIAVFPATENVEESVTEKFGDEAKALFGEYPDKDAFHFTSDGLAFFQHGDARNHASTLEDKEVITKTRK